MSNTFTDKPAMTRWKNISDRKVVLNFHVSHAVFQHTALGSRVVVPAVAHRVAWEPGDVQEVPSDFDESVHQTQCTICPNAQSMHNAAHAEPCTDPSHERVIVGGQGAFTLRRVDGPHYLLSSFLLDHLDQAAKYERDHRNEQERRKAIAQQIDGGEK
jgi:hypothetical protein